MNAYREALDCQSACNVSGIVRSLAKLTEQLWEEARANNQGTDYVNRHPVVVLFLAQMVFLSTGGTIDSAAYNAAYAECEKRAD